jgi:hypothetical protein
VLTALAICLSTQSRHSVDTRKAPAYGFNSGAYSANLPPALESAVVYAPGILIYSLMREIGAKTAMLGNAWKGQADRYIAGEHPGKLCKPRP